MAVEENVKRGSGGKVTFFVMTFLIFLVLLGAGFAYMQYALFKIKAEGIAIGYQRAASSAYQMGRPIPDSIFEDGNYRVEVKTNFNSAGQPTEISVNVKDLYTNITHYTSSRSLSNMPVNNQNQGVIVQPQTQSSP